MSEPIEYVPAYMVQRRYFIFQSWSMAKSIWAGKPTPKEVSKLWWYWCRLRFWRYQLNYDGTFLVKINKWTRNYHFQENWSTPTSAEVWSDIGNTFGRIAKRGR